MTSDTVSPPAKARFTTRQWLIIALLCGAQFMLALDFSILSVALPVLGKDLGFALSDLQWVVTAFALPSGGLLLLFGRAADLYGRRNWFIVGMALFTVASLAGGLATTPGFLLAARAVQGVAAAMLTPAAMSLLTTNFAEGAQRDRALGINGALLSLGFLSGVVLGGVITELTSWRVTLFISVPVGVAAVIAAPILIKESRNEETPRLDILGALTVTGGLLSVIYGVTSAERNGWGAATTLISFAAGAVLLAAFFAVESRVAAPLVDLGVLRRRTVSWGNTTGLITFAMMTGMVFLLTLYMQKVRGMTPLDAGFSFAALGVAAVLGGAFAARIIGRIGVHRALVYGLVLQAASTAVLYLLDTDGGMPLLLVATAAGGFGHLLAVVGYMITATSGLPDHEQGLATGLAYTGQQLGVTVGTPILATVAASGIESAGGSGPAAVLHGVQGGLLTAAAALAVAAVIAVAFLRPARTTAAPVAGTAAAETVPADAH
ncbi:MULTISPECIES: MFS transporter [Streptomyces]|uniref:MFS transporter n=1 Tax=Streptomyces argyrophylli TaxID=2726118 RepID=A0A6M4PMS7_9ACTN|nr:MULTISPECIES: MFS transporter [Streptomyces]QJS11026.1 MFS transporter [Streptomyces argyrophyllae]